MTVCPLIADRLREANIFGTAATRKLFNSVGEYGHVRSLNVLLLDYDADCFGRTVSNEE
jgi:hypothetical protein